VQGGSRGATYRAAGNLGVRAQGNRREIPGELNAGGRCGRKGAELTRGPGASERGGNACGEGGPAKRARTVREGDAVGRWRGGVQVAAGATRSVGARRAGGGRPRRRVRGLMQRGERDGVGLAALGRTRGAEGSWARVGFSWARDLGWVSRGGGIGPGSRVGLLG